MYSPHRGQLYYFVQVRSRTLSGLLHLVRGKASSSVLMHPKVGYRACHRRQGMWDGGHISLILAIPRHLREGVGAALLLLQPQAQLTCTPVKKVALVCLLFHELQLGRGKASFPILLVPGPALTASVGGKGRREGRHFFPSPMSPHGKCGVGG